MNSLSHFNQAGAAHMVDVGDKPASSRTAIAEGHITMQPHTLALIMQGNHKKGDVLGIARIAAIMASKKTAELIPLCHPIPLTHVDVELQAEPERHRVYCRVTVRTIGQTGVEMEALTAVQIALLTIYDMCKAVDRGMAMNSIRLLKKSGGKSGRWEHRGQIHSA